jgi:hypothetical protein
MLRASLIAVSLALGAAVAAAPASADHVRCPIGQYLFGLETATPKPSKLRAHNLPRKTDGYAPRCLVAEAIVAEIQLGYGEKGRLPARLSVFGARWSGGRWRCSYPEGRGVCRKIGKPRRRVTMNLQL